MITHGKYIPLCALCGLFALPAMAASQNITANTREFRLELGASRVIYDLDANGAAISVINQQAFPILVQGKVLEEDKKTAAPFVVTPPVFRLDAHQQSQLRIIRTGGEAPANKEALKWLCIAGVPPKNSDVWAQGKDGKPVAPTSASLQMEISSRECIKLLVRPSGLEGSYLQAASALSWSQQGNSLEVKNSGPYYINLRSVSVGNNELPKPGYIPPFSSHKFAVTSHAGDQVNWKVITDEGGDSAIFKAKIS